MPTDAIWVPSAFHRMSNGAPTSPSNQRGALPPGRRSSGYGGSKSATATAEPSGLIARVAGCGLDGWADVAWTRRRARGSCPRRSTARSTSFRSGRNSGPRPDRRRPLRRADHPWRCRRPSSVRRRRRRRAWCRPREVLDVVHIDVIAAERQDGRSRVRVADVDHPAVLGTLGDEDVVGRAPVEPPADILHVEQTPAVDVTAWCKASTACGSTAPSTDLGLVNGDGERAGSPVRDRRRRWPRRLTRVHAQWHHDGPHRLRRARSCAVAASGRPRSRRR